MIILDAPCGGLLKSEYVQRNVMLDLQVPIYVKTGSSYGRRGGNTIRFEIC